MTDAPSKTLIVTLLLMAFTFAAIATQAQSSALGALEVDRTGDTVDAALHSEVDGQSHQKPPSSSVFANSLYTNFSLHKENESSETAAWEPISRYSGDTAAGYRGRYGRAQCNPDIGHASGVQESSSYPSFRPLNGQRDFTKWQAVPATSFGTARKKNNKTYENDDPGAGSFSHDLGSPVKMSRANLCTHATASELPAVSFPSVPESANPFDSNVPFASSRLGIMEIAPFNGTGFSTNRGSASTKRRRLRNRQSESAEETNPWLESLQPGHN